MCKYSSDLEKLSHLVPLCPVSPLTSRGPPAVPTLPPVAPVIAWPRRFEGFGCGLPCPAVSDSQCGVLESARHPGALLRPGPVPEASRGASWDDGRPCRPVKFPHAHPASACPGASFWVPGQCHSSRTLPIRDFSLRVRLKVRERSSGFHLAQAELLRSRNVGVIGTEMGPLEDPHCLRYFTPTPGISCRR